MSTQVITLTHSLTHFCLLTARLGGAQRVGERDAALDAQCAWVAKGGGIGDSGQAVEQQGRPLSGIQAAGAIPLGPKAALSKQVGFWSGGVGRMGCCSKGTLSVLRRRSAA